MKSLIKKTNIPLLFALMGIICVYCYWIDNAKCIVPRPFQVLCKR